MRLGLAGPVCGLLYAMNLKFEPRIDLFHSPHSAATGCDDDRQREASHQRASLLIKLVHPDPQARGPISPIKMVETGTWLNVHVPTAENPTMPEPQLHGTATFNHDEISRVGR
jgi:hypothetical protein